MADDEPGRFIIVLEVEGVQRIKAARFEFGSEPGLHLITGRNRQGKTSALQSMSMLMGGKGEIGKRVIRDGLEEATVRADLGDLIVTRKFRKSEEGDELTEVVARSADGRSKYDKPQTMLKGLTKTTTLDPVVFIDMKREDRFKTLSQFVKNFDFEKNRRRYKQLFDARTDVNREVLRCTRAAEAIGFPDDTPKVRVSIERISKELQKGADANTSRERAVALLAANKQDQERYKAAIADMREQITKLQERIQAGLGKVEDLVMAEKATVIPPEIDTSAIRRELDNANKTNRNVDLRKQREDLEAMARDQEREAFEMTAELQAMKDAERQAVAEAQMPIPGLTLSDDDVLLNGVPFENASHAEQLEAAIAIAAAENPSFRAVLVREGSLMDSAAIKSIHDLAIKFNLQIIMEKVDESKGVGFVMEDGELISTPESRATGLPVPQVQSTPKIRKRP